MRIHIRTFLVVVLAAAAFTLLPYPARPQVPIASAAAGDAVLTWNENAGEAATAACIAPLANPLHESRMYAITAHRHPRCAQCHRSTFPAVRVRWTSSTGRFSGRRRGRSCTNCAGRAHRSTPV